MMLLVIAFYVLCSVLPATTIIEGACTSVEVNSNLLFNYDHFNFPFYSYLSFLQ
jgi:hypothetical protein